ncbi:MAG: rhodanese-like domain-containing protein [Gemmatimonadota bacterium]|nr:rhodanese-like domain-containing protein [Gemmatimonadota bacterium]
MKRPTRSRVSPFSVPAASALVAASLLGAPLGAEPQEPGLTVGVDWLAAHLDDVVLLHVGSDSSFAEGHIPGAVFVARDRMSHPGSHSPDALILELPEADAFQEALRAWGVNDDSRVVVTFGADEWVTPTARLVFTLDWAGLGDRTSYLDGGAVAWTAAGHALTGEAAAPARGNVTIHPRDIVVDAEWVQAHQMTGGYRLVDARSPAFFDGVREDRGVAGHIPGAGNVHWNTLVDEETLLLKPLPELRSLFEAAGVEDGDTVVGYCHIGQYATLMLLSARLLGHDVVLYDGAFQDWATRGLPAETAKGR